MNVITTGPVWSVSLSLGLAGCAGPQQLLYYSSRQGSLAESPVYKVQYKRTVGSPRDLAGKSLAKLKPHQPFSAAHANGTTHMYGTYGYTNLHTLSQLHTHTDSLPTGLNKPLLSWQILPTGFAMRAVLELWYLMNKPLIFFQVIYLILNKGDT